MHCRGVQELKTLQLNFQCAFNKKRKNTWTTSPCKTWERWIICITFSTIPLFGCFCNDFFFWVFTHNFWATNISSFGKWSYFYNIHLDNCYLCKCLYIFIWFPFTFHNYFYKQFYHNTGWMTIAPSYNSLTQIQQIPCCDVFPEKHLSAWCYISNIFSVASSETSSYSK